MEQYNYENDNGEDIKVDVYPTYTTDAIEFYKDGDLQFMIDGDQGVDLSKKILEHFTKEKEDKKGYIYRDPSVPGSMMCDMFADNFSAEGPFGKVRLERYHDGDVLFVVGDNAFKGTRNGDKKEDAIIQLNAVKGLIEYLTKHVNEVEGMMKDGR